MMRLSWILALVAVTGLSGCEIFLDGFELGLARQASGVEPTVAGPEAYGL